MITIIEISQKTMSKSSSYVPKITLCNNLPFTQNTSSSLT